MRFGSYEDGFCNECSQGKKTNCMSVCMGLRIPRHGIKRTETELSQETSALEWEGHGAGGGEKLYWAACLC